MSCAIKAQRGFMALLSLWLVVAMASASLLMLAKSRPVTDSAMINRQVLQQAKDALLAYALSNNERSPGRYLALPCPDTGNSGFWGEGISHGSCGSRYRPTLGWLPWRTLGLPPLLDAAGECLWYAVSGAVKNNPAPRLANTDSIGDFKVYTDSGNTELTAGDPRQQAVAVLIAPGRPVPGQQRSRGDSICGEDNAATYLEQAGGFDNSRAGTSWLHTATDTMIFISTAELQTALAARDDMWRQLAATDADSLLRRTAMCLAEHVAASGILPWAAPLRLSDSRDDKAYDDARDTSFGRLPDKVNNSGGKTARLIRNCRHFRSTAWKKLWQNWKDHLFYAMTPGHSVDTPCTTDCVSYDGTQYVAIIWFAGKRLERQQRRDSANWRDWLEAADWPGKNGLDYLLTTGNDTVLCLDKNLSVERCGDS